MIERAGVSRWIEAAGRTDLGERYRIAAERRAEFLALARDARRDEPEGGKVTERQSESGNG